MVIGPFINASAILLGGVLGALLSQHLPERIRISMTSIFGLCSLGIGILLVIKCVNLPVMVLATLIGALIGEFCHLEKAHVQPGSIVGPYARLRPGADIAEEAHVGNFVEIKNAKLGPGAKANHLSYIGDAVVGAKANIGAGVITCNYDGVNKHTTVIGQGAFIGSNASLVAPVQIGENATIGAGSTISKNVPADNLSLTRAVQKILPWKKRTRS